MKRGIAFLLVCLMLGGCGEVEAAPTPTPTVAVTVVPEVTQSASALQVSDESGGRSVVAELNAWGEWELFLFSDEPLFDVLVSKGGMGEWYDKDFVFIDQECLGYLPELAVGEAIRLISTMPETTPYIQISYFTAAGDYEVVHLGYNGRDGGGILVPAEPQVAGRLYLGEGEDGGAPTSYTWASEDVIALLNTGALVDYVPMGLTVFDGAVADINCDGIEDVALALMSDGNLPAEYRCDNLPMFLLLGKAGGGYEVAQKFASGLFMPYRSDCRVEAGEGYIEFHYSLAAGARPPHTALTRFAFDGAGDWILSEYAYHFTFLYGSELADPVTELISAPEYAQVPISEFDLWEMPDSFRPEQHQVVKTMLVEDERSANMTEPSEIEVTIAVNRSTAGYEGVVYRYYEFRSGSSYSIICTIKGELAAEEELSIVTDEGSGAFTIGNDRWTWNPQPASFYKNLPW